MFLIRLLAFPVALAWGWLFRTWSSREPAAQPSLLPASVALLLAGPVFAVGVQAWLLHPAGPRIPLGYADSVARWSAAGATAAGLLASLIVAAGAYLFRGRIDGTDAPESAAVDVGGGTAAGIGAIAWSILFGAPALAITSVWYGTSLNLTLTRFLIGSRISTSSAVHAHSLVIRELAALQPNPSGFVEMSGPLRAFADSAVLWSCAATAVLLVAGLAGWFDERGTPAGPGATALMNRVLVFVMIAALAHVVYEAGLLIWILTV